MLENNTHNQHYLSQVEQRLNALNPNAAPKNSRIYSFRVADRENYSLELENPNGRSIDNNLSLDDLFSFDVLDNSSLRLNFESLFQKHETKIEGYTKSLIAKLNSRDDDIKTEIIELFIAKLLNFVRNPFSIKKVLNTFPKLATYDPTDPDLLAMYRRIVNGKKPQQTYLCDQLGISEQQYIEWLRMLFILLTPLRDGHVSFFEQVIKELLENKKSYVTALVCQYDQAGCLLSDRGYCQPIPDDDHMAFSFNLCSTAFITYMLTDPKKLVQGCASTEFIDQAVAN